MNSATRFHLRFESISTERLRGLAKRMRLGAVWGAQAASL